MLPHTATREVLQLKVTLREIRPPIWRRLLFPAHRTLADLHHAIQAAFGWEESHLHVFEVMGQDYGPPDPEEEVEARDEKVVIARFGLRPKMKMHYTYDFGDSWVHDIAVEKVMVPEAPIEDPSCLGGRRACPPEDCGGTGGYEHVVEALQDPTYPEREDLVAWLGEKWNPEEFCLDEANARLKARFTPARTRSPRRSRKTPEPQSVS